MAVRKLGKALGPDCGVNVAAAMGGGGGEKPVAQYLGSGPGWGTTNSEWVSDLRGQKKSLSWG